MMYSYDTYSYKYTNVSITCHKYLCMYLLFRREWEKQEREREKEREREREG